MPQIGKTFVVKKRSEALDLYRKVRKVKTPIALDTEFGTDSRGKTYITVWSLSWAKGIRYCLYAKPSLEVFTPWIEDKTAPKVLYNFSADAESFADCGIKLRGLHADVMVMDALVDTAERVHNLKHAVARYIGRRRFDFKATFSYVPKGKVKPVMYTWDEILGSKELRRKLYEYSASDSEDLIMLYNEHKRTLKRQDWNYWPTFLKEDRPFTITLYRMMGRGFPIDISRLQQLERDLTVSLLRKAHIFRATVDEPQLNLDSPEQMQELFFKKLEYPAIKATKGAKKKLAQGAPAWQTYSVDKGVLTAWAEAGLTLAQRLLDYREINTIRKTFVSGLLHGLDKDGRLYSDFNQIGAQTGRISSRKFYRTVMVPKRAKGGVYIQVPKRVKVGANLQNIPVRSELGKEIRRVFIAGPGYKLLVCDYSGIEWWLMAWLSKDRNILLQARNKIDPHSFTAKKLFNLKCHWKEIKERYEQWRALAKTCNFGFIYGCGDEKAAVLTGKPVPVAAKYKRGFFRLYNGITDYHRDIVRFCKRHGYVQTISGRRRHIPDIHSSDDIIAGHAERTAINSPDQGSAADIIRRAMNRLDRDGRVKQLKAELLVAVHDELVWRVPEDSAEKLQKHVVPIMADSYSEILSKDGIPLPVGSGIGDNWAQAK